MPRNKRFTQTPLLVLGLGNPGSEYTGTRHNAGYRVVDIMMDTVLPGSSAVLKKPFFSFLPYLIAEHQGWPGGRPLVLMRYAGYMNASGSGVCAVLKRYRAQVSDLLVVVDNMDLAPGECRLRQGGGTAGHNGLKSISAALGGGGYSRLYIGVGRPKGGVSVVDHVLGHFEPEDLALAEQACRRGAEGIAQLSRVPFNRVAEELNRRGN